MTRFLVMASLAAATVVMAAAACTKPNPAFCTSSMDCKDPAKPFCDVDGKFGDLTNDCIATPPIDAGPDAAGPDADPLGDAGTCTPGASLACSADTLDVCAADGHSFTQTTCPLGCAPGGALRCATFEPSNGLGSALADAGSAGDVVIPRGSTIDTDTGAVTDSNGSAVAVVTEVVHQTGGPDIRVLLGASFSIDDVTASGSAALAIVSPGEVHIVGKLDVSAHQNTGGPGSVRGSFSCVGGNNPDDLSNAGAGGGGNATAGGAGAATHGDLGRLGGTIQTTSDLDGGCAGGSKVVLYKTGSIFVPTTFDGGGGGGAVAIVSASEIELTISGAIDASGGGGGSAAVSSGGGAGGTIVLESPAIGISGSESGMVANGGAGGACGDSAPGGQFSTAPAPAPNCSPGAGGNGGTFSSPSGSGVDCTSTNSGTCPGMLYGAGGGGAGWLRLSSRGGQIAITDAPTISAVEVVTALAPE